jgi:hypothetical protein
MRQLRLTIPELALIAGTRAALGAGIAFLLADHIPRERRIAVGWSLLTIGAFSTIPLAFEVLGRSRAPHELVPDRSEEGWSAAPSRPMGRREPFAW